MEIPENDIVVGADKMPEIWYFDPNNPSSYKIYYPDIYIPSDNIIIEVKSMWTYKKDKRIVHEKLKATKALGI